MKPMALKRADFAGSWYPGARRECLEAIDELERAWSGPGGIGEKTRMAREAWRRGAAARSQGTGGIVPPPISCTASLVARP